MATTWIKPLHANKGKTIAQTITDRTDYAENPEKIRKGELVTGYQCSPFTVDAEFLLSKQQYADIIGRDQGRRDILVYHIRQAFKPGEITPELANKLGYELAMRFAKGRHAFIVATHIDKSHIHNHIVFNSTTLDNMSKFQNPLRSNKIIRRISDHICLENGLSIIENPQPSRGHYGTWLGENKEPTWREKLQILIDDVLAKKPADFFVFLKMMEMEKCTVKHGKHISIKMEGQKRFTRLRSLGEDYSEEAIRERISGKRANPPRRKTAISSKPPKVNLLIDLQNSIKAQDSPGYAHWAKVFNLKQAAQTLIFLQENGLDDIEKLIAAAQKAKDDFNGINTRIQSIDKRLGEITALQKHIGSYSKTREVYIAYRKAEYSKKFLAAHEGDIATHKAAKQYFDSLKLEKLPTIGKLKTDYGELLGEKKKLYSGYRQARKHMQDILMAKQNTEQILGHQDTVKEKDMERV